jgi:glycogen debranching enzyme
LERSNDGRSLCLVTFGVNTGTVCSCVKEGQRVSDGGKQPLLHDLVTTFSAPVTVLSEPSGQIRRCAAQGVFAADLRVLCLAEVRVNGRAPEPVTWASRGHRVTEFVGVLRSLGDPGPDPTVWLRRRRTVTADGCGEELRLDNATVAGIDTVVEVAVSADLASMDVVKHGRSVPARPAELAGELLHWTAGPVTVVLEAPDSEIELDAAHAEPTLRWTLTVPPRASVTVSWELTVTDRAAAVVGPATAAPNVPRVSADDRRIPALVQRACDDLAGLRAAPAASPTDVFLAAGSPWYLTLFGRDSLWSARMLLPLGTDLAAGTLRALADRQGRVERIDRAEQPGKIPHELRRAGAEYDAGRAEAAVTLPPLYYGSVDATPLWVCLLADAWRWGLPSDEVESLLPTAERALDWLARHGDPDRDGFVEYRDESGRGLANQGWKDSGDSIRFADGRIAEGPVALAEVQGYAYEAARAGAALLDAFGRPGADRWRDYAGRLADRFREQFWVEDDLGAYPALALDGSKQPVDAPTSNMGHLLGTGLLSVDESAAVARRLVDPTMSSGFGLRTMAATTGGYSPLSYHCGSVWPHDTAIAVHGLLRAGSGREAAVLAEGLLAAADEFQGRLPELYGGFSAADVPVPVPYPAACRPQAWSAAAAVVVLQAFLGLEADVPAGTMTLRPSGSLGMLHVDGLAVAGHRFAAGVWSDGSPVLPTAPPGLRVLMAGR